MAQVLEPQRDPLEGRLIAGGKYRLDRFRAADELGRVYLGCHLALERPLTIKVLHGSYLTDEQLVNRFERAGLAASRVRHQNVVDVVDLGREKQDGLLYLVQEYIEGRTLEEIVAQEGPLDARRVADIGMQMAAALGAAHAAGVVHRDVKPANVIVLDRESDEGELSEVVKVLDFGVAKLQEALADQPKHMTIAMVSGTPEYMSPEHCNGLALDARSSPTAMHAREPVEPTVGRLLSLTHRARSHRQPTNGRLYDSSCASRPTVGSTIPAAPADQRSALRFSAAPADQRSALPFQDPRP